MFTVFWEMGKNKNCEFLLCVPIGLKWKLEENKFSECDQCYQCKINFAAYPNRFHNSVGLRPGCGIGD